ncbi:PEP-CTERM sorting domain-containing protein [Laspinema olomoucense]|uniref:PEP-CTERM sorting domain-containing protein n=1 Tax=Laspinema olomoucense TaxID=3231600 RepID=UPI0021BB35C0|nr:PEP-CTERM sorting domain-containing protein [Laspinema sp. D3d]MCT7973530.1 PEP-CTERM sorting domain-containing protein [Laspinema sp. D3d]
MPKLLLNRPRILTLFAVVFSSMGVLNATPANGLTFKGSLSSVSHPVFRKFEIEYTLADGMFDTIVSSPPNTFFIDGEYTGAPGYYDSINRATVVPEVVTDFKFSGGGSLQPLNGELSLFGITEDRLYLWILQNTEPRFTDIFTGYIKAPAGLPLSACKFQACEMSAKYGDGYMGPPGFDMIQTPVMESESVPEPSAAVALGFVAALLMKRRRKTLSAQAVVTADLG